MKGIAKAAFATVMALLAACAPQGMRMVDAVDSGAFTIMSRAMHDEMVKRNLVDRYGSWYSPLISLGPFRAGEKLVNRLSPKFRFPHTSVTLPKTFRDMMGEDARLSLRGPNAVIEQGLSRVELRLLAVADWNGDGKDDWLVLCRVGNTDEPNKFRDYYVVVEDLKRAIWEPVLLMVLDHVYGKVTAVGDPANGALAESLSTDYLQGQAPILEAPGREKQRGIDPTATRLRQSRLSN